MVGPSMRVPSSFSYTLQCVLQNRRIRATSCRYLFSSPVAFLLNRMVIVTPRPTPRNLVRAGSLAQSLPELQILLFAVSPVLSLHHILGIGKNLDETGVFEGFQSNRGRDNLSLIVGSLSQVLPDDSMLLLAFLINVYEHRDGSGPRRRRAISK